MTADKYYEENVINWKVKWENENSKTVSVNIHLMEVKVIFSLELPLVTLSSTSLGSKDFSLIFIRGHLN